MTKDFRFGVNLFGTGTGADFLDRVAQVERSGADIVLVPDHLGFVGPLPALVAAAAAAPGLRVGTFVLNAPFHRPALLARDLATVDQLTGGRLEIGLGAGYVEAEFEAAGIPFGRPGERVDQLQAMVEHLRAHLGPGGGHVPAPVQTPPPIMVAGGGDRVLTLAARHADIVGLQSVPHDEALRQRVAFVRRQAGERFDALELNLIVFELAADREPDLAAVRGMHPDRTDEQLRASPHVLHGSPSAIAERVRHLRDEMGVSYVTVLDPAPADLAGLAAAIALLRG